jgi:hypothetical protein
MNSEVGGQTTQVLAASAMAALLAVTASCGPAPGADIAAGEIITRPTAYVGQSLTVSGRVEDVYPPRAFTIDSGMQDGDLLVLSTDSIPELEQMAAERGRGDGMTALVTGTVRLFVATEIEREVGWDLDPRLEKEFNNKSVIISRSTTFAPK